MAIGEYEDTISRLDGTIQRLTDTVATLSGQVITLVAEFRHIQEETKPIGSTREEVSLLKQKVEMQELYQSRQTSLNRWLIGAIITVGLGIAGFIMTLLLSVLPHITYSK